MFGKGIRLFTIFGFEVKLDWSWLILALLITWSLAAGLFPAMYEGFSTSIYWWMGAAGTIGLFFSVVFHELAHSLVARRHGIPMHGITLFIFGGMAEMTEEPQNPKSEIYMAVIGPITSIIIGLICLGVYYAWHGALSQSPVGGVINYLGFINLVLAGFNLIPAFPLDGGRILRSILWATKKNLRKATSIASKIGSGFGFLLLILGVVNIVSGNFIGGIWIFLIGLFIRGASQSSYQQLLVRQALEGEKVSRFMKKDPITVTPDLAVDDLVEDYIYRYHHKMFPVQEDNRLRGCVTINDVKNIKKEERDRHKVSEIIDECSDSNTISPDTDAVEALSRMRKNQKTRLMVVENGNLVGVLTLKDMLEFLNMKMDLEEELG
ncbi:MAG TPA: CBS domain-containing protein [candidate division Zixibacteria bacterium]|nr:CBS domain-containing protein [candidate division Zixibacteria bacterium]